MIYFIVGLFLLIGFFLFDVVKLTKGKSLFYFLNFILLVLLAGLRYKTGGDSLAYQDMFDDIPNLSQLRLIDLQNAEFQPLWYLLNATIKSFGNSFTIFQLVHAIFVNGCIFYFFKKYSKHYFLAIVLYYLFGYTYFNMEILREAIAICIFLLSVNFLLKKKYIPYFITILIAFGFHLSAFILFFIPIALFFVSKKFSWWNILILISLISIVGSLSLLLNLASFLSSEIQSDVMLTKVEHYTSAKLNLNGLIMILFKLLPIILLVLLNNKIDIAEENQHYWRKFLAIYFILFTLAIIQPGLFERFQNYLFPFYLLSIVQYYDSLYVSSNNLHRKKTYYRIIILCLLITQTYYYTRDMSMYASKGTRFYHLYYPYISVFDPYEIGNREILFYNQLGD